MSANTNAVAREIVSAAPASIEIGQRVADSYDDATGEITMPKFRLIDGSHA